MRFFYCKFKHSHSQCHLVDGKDKQSNLHVLKNRTLSNINYSSKKIELANLVFKRSLTWKSGMQKNKKLT